MNYWFLYTSAGAIYGTPYLGDAQEWTNIPSECAGVLGPIEATDLTATDAWQNPSHYTVQNGALVNTVTEAQLLKEAASAQQTTLQAAFDACITGGFTAKSTGHTYPSTQDSQNNIQAALKLFELDTQKTSENYQTLDAGFVSHTQTELQNVFIEGGRWMEAQRAEIQSLLAQVDTLAGQAGTTIAQIQAIVWEEADYIGINTG